MCYFHKLVKFESFIHRRRLLGHLRLHWMRIFLLSGIFLVPTIVDVSFSSETTLHFPNDVNITIKEESLGTKKSTVYDAEDADNEIMLSSSRGKVNDLLTEIFDGKRSKTAEISTENISKSWQPDYENPIVTTRLLYEKGHAILPRRNICSGNGRTLTLMMVITSSMNNCAQRQAIRSSWASVAQRDDIDAAFLVGKSANHYDNQLLTKESEMYGDIIQGNFMDTYNNLTLKSLSMLEWTLLHCNQTRFLLKVDDDVFVNPDVLLAILKRHKKQRKAIIGQVARSWKLDRRKHSKYYVPRGQYKNAMYPTFVAGPAYVLTNDVIAPLYSAALDQEFFKLEDVFLTGFVARTLNIALINYLYFYHVRPNGLAACEVKRFVAAVHGINPLEMVKLWNEISNITLSDCPYNADDYNYYD